MTRHTQVMLIHIFVSDTARKKHLFTQVFFGLQDHSYRLAEAQCDGFFHLGVRWPSAEAAIRRGFSNVSTSDWNNLLKKQAALDKMGALHPFLHIFSACSQVTASPDSRWHGIVWYINREIIRRWTCSRDPWKVYERCHERYHAYQDSVKPILFWYK